jgi:two-component system, cell cycle sensor histidine kinase and response regulator CckA
MRNTAHGVLLLRDAIIDCNERFGRMLAGSRETLLGRSPLDLSPELQADGAYSRERWQRRVQAAAAGLPQWFPWQFTDVAGRRVHALVHLASHAPLPRTLIAHVHDLSNLRHAGWLKPESEARLRDVLDHTKAVIFVKDRDGRYVFANRELERAVRMPAERIIGYTDQDIWPPELAERFRANDTQVLEQRTATEFEVTGIVGGQRRTFISFKFPLFDANGDPYALCGIATDVTARKRTEDALTSAALAVSSAQGVTVFQELVRYLATILEVDCALIAAPWEGAEPCRVRVHAFFLDGKIRENFEYAIGGTPCETVMGQCFRIYPSGLPSIFPADADFAKLGFQSYAGYPLTDGRGAPLGLISVVSRAPLVNADFVESILKIFAVRAAAELERQRAEETLRVSEASYRAIFESSEDAIFVHDWETGAIVDVNRRACEVYGYEYEEMKRIGIADVSSGMHPYTIDEAMKRLAQARTGQPVRMEWQRRNKDSSLHWDEVVLRPAIIAGKPRILAFTREITERKQAERALRQAQKMEALGHLTGGIAHDFNNLLTSIMGYVLLGKDRASAAGDPKLAGYLEQAHLSCTRARDLIQQMLTFSRGQRGEPRPLALPRLIEDSVKLFRPTLPSTIEIRTELAEDVASVMLDPVHFDQILLNLCLNARDAMSGVGTIRIAARGFTANQAVCTACHKSVSGGYVALIVEDDGPGIDPAVLERIFEPFFTTKEVGKGSGMGLATVHGIVHEYGGHLLVDTAPGRGTRFQVLFPAHPDVQVNDGKPAAGMAPTLAPQLSGCVLVVDDEQTVASFMCDLLESWGLEAAAASNAAQACQLFDERSGGYDLVITDQTMPKMTGVELAAALREKRPDLPIILYTGLNDALPRSVVERSGIRAVVGKPVEPHELFGLLQTHLPHVVAH